MDATAEDLSDYACRLTYEDLSPAAFQHGAVTAATFAPSRIQDPALRPLIKKLTVVEDPEFTRRYPAESCTRIEVTTTDRGRISAETNQRSRLESALSP